MITKEQLKQLPEEFHFFSEIKVSYIFQIGSPKEIANAFQWLNSGFIEYFHWDTEEKMLRVQVDKKMVAFDIKEGKFNIRAQEEIYNNLHVMTAFIALIYLFQEKTLTGYQINQVMMEQLYDDFIEQFDEEGEIFSAGKEKTEEKKRNLPKKYVLIYKEEFYVEVEFIGPFLLREAVDFGARPGPFGQYLYDLSLGNIAENLKKIINTGNSLGIPVLYENAPKELLFELKYPILRTQTKTLVRLDYDKDQVTVQNLVQNDAIELREDTKIDYISNDIAILSTGHVIQILPAAPHSLAKLVKKLFRIGSDGSYQLNQINEILLEHFDTGADQRLKAETYFLKDDDDMVDGKEFLKALPSVSSNIVHHLGDEQMASFSLRNDLGQETSLIRVHNLEYEIIEQWKFRELLSSKKRRFLILDQAIQMLMIESLKGQKEYIKNLFKEKNFWEKYVLQAKAKGFLTKFSNTFGKENSKPILQFKDKEHPLFSQTFSPRKYLLYKLSYDKLVEKHNVESLIDDLEIFAEMPPQLTGFLQELSIVAKACDVEIIINGMAIRTIPLTITIEAVENHNIDWFELKPEVQCGELQIPQEDWERIIAGKYMPQIDGYYYLPEMDSREALEKLQQLFQSPQKKKQTNATDEIMASVPRLQILEWLELRKMGVQITLPPQAKKIFDRLENLESIPETPLPKTINATLRHYQQEGFSWLVFLYENRFGACLADDMGLGKTLQAITFLGHLYTDKSTDLPPSLIVVPPSLLFNWQSEVQRFCPNLRVGEYHSTNRDLESLRDVHLILTTYNMVHRDIEILEKESFTTLVLDETQNLKNITAARTKAALRLQRKFTLCLTGTPMENHVGEYYTIMNFALPGIFGDYKTFRKEIKAGNDHVLRRANPFILRRTKEKILKELPPKVENNLYLEMTEEQKEFYTRTVGEVREEVLEAYKDKTKSQAGIIALSALSRLRQICISPQLVEQEMTDEAPKISYLLDKMEELMDEGHAGLIFSQFTKTLDILERKAKEAKLPTLRLDGSVSAPNRKKLVETFQNSEQPHLFLISLKAGGVGLNLTRANYVFHADPWWNPAVENQASDRAHRMGQKQTVFIQRLLMRHTIEEKMIALKERKQALFDAIINDPTGKKKVSTAFSKEDFDFLLGNG